MARILGARRPPRQRVLVRRARGAVSEVLGTFLMLAVTIMLVAVLYLLVAGPARPPAETSQIVFSVGPASENATNHSRNDTVFSVSTKLGNGDILWNDSSLQVYILDENGTLMVAHNQTVDDVNGDGKADAPDRVVLRGMTAAYHGRHLMVNYHQRIVADIAIP